MEKKKEIQNKVNYLMFQRQSDGESHGLLWVICILK
jgi:hypothetical protein